MNCLQNLPRSSSALLLRSFKSQATVHPCFVNMKGLMNATDLRRSCSVKATPSSPSSTNMEDAKEEEKSNVYSTNMTEAMGAGNPATMTSNAASNTVPSSGTASKRNKIAFQFPKPQPKVTKGIDSLVRKTPEEVVEERHTSSRSSQSSIESRLRTPEEKERVHDHIADFFYECGIPFNAANSRAFEVMIESIGQYGSGLKPPTFHDLRGPLLEKAKKKTIDLRARHEVAWKQYGCSLMSDGWTDKRGRHLVNFLVNSPEGTYFMGSVDASSEIHDANTLASLLDNKMEEIGHEHVVQIVTDNGANYKAAVLLDRISVQADLYGASRDMFAREMSIRQRNLKNPLDWWTSFGGRSLELTNFAYRILGLCCSSSGCERNWSTFEFIHTKKRNRLEHKRLNDLVYIQYNRKIFRRFQKRRETGQNFDPLSIDDFDWQNEWINERPSNEVVNPGEDLTWDDVDRATGASEAMTGRNLSRNAQRETPNVTNTYSRRRVGSTSREPRLLDSDSGEDVGIATEEEFPNDDVDIDDDFGQPSPTSSNENNDRDEDGEDLVLDDFI